VTHWVTFASAVAFPDLVTVVVTAVAWARPGRHHGRHAAGHVVLRVR
jgi:hypothetical protein